MNKHTYTVTLNDTELLKLKELVMAGLKVAEARGMESEYTDIFMKVSDKMEEYYTNNDIFE